MRLLRETPITALLLAIHVHGASLDGRVAHVVDGDTLDVIVHGKRIRVRILDIDAPEGNEFYGQIAPASRSSHFAAAGRRRSRATSTIGTAACSHACVVTVSMPGRTSASRNSLGVRALLAV